MTILCDDIGGRVLRRDWFNGGRWQWKYFKPDIGRWFDFGESFATYEQAIEKYPILK